MIHGYTQLYRKLKQKDQQSIAVHVVTGYQSKMIFSVLLSTHIKNKYKTILLKKDRLLALLNRKHTIF